MKHVHHIIPKHMGGTDESSNLIELTVEEHAQAHLRLYETHGKKEDLCAYYMLSGKNQDPEFVSLRAQLAAASTRQTRIDSGLSGAELFYGRTASLEEIRENSSKGGSIQGQRNAESGHMREIQKLSDCSEAGKKGSEICRIQNKNAFFDPELRAISQSMGGKVQGKRNAESGHMREMSKKSKRNTGMFWITNGIDSKMIKNEDSIENGWYRGRVQKTKI